MSDFHSSSSSASSSSMLPHSPVQQRPLSRERQPTASLSQHIPNATALNGTTINKDIHPPSASTSKNICICVRCPTYPNESFQVQVHPDEHVAQLKAAISVQFPGHPSPDDMRLIHAGKLLTDNVAVRDLNRPDIASPPTVHLVVKGGQPSISTFTDADNHSGLRQRSVPSRETPDTNVSSSSSATTVPIPSTTQPAPISTASSSAIHAYNPLFPSAQAAMPIPPLAGAYQIVLINGLPYAMHIPVHPQAYQPPAMTDPLLNQAATPTHPIAAQPNPPPAPGPPPARLAVPMQANAPAAVNQDDEFGDQQRNAPQNPFWLLIKLTFLVYIFSSNSSFAKIVFMNIVALVIFFIQTGRLRVARRPTQTDPVARQQESESGEQTSSTGAGTEAPHPSQRSPWADAKNVAYMFFASLIPEHHDGI